MSTNPGMETSVELMLDMIRELRDWHQDAEDRARGTSDRHHTLQLEVANLTANIRELRTSIDRATGDFDGIPQRIVKVERFIWAASLIAAAMGVIIGGIAQKAIVDNMTRRGVINTPTIEGPP